jgi:hypothetical protein
VDDGYSEGFSTIRPLLLDYRVPAIFFVPTDFIDNRVLFYRNKVSLCIDSVRKLPETRLPATLNEAASIAGRELRDGRSLERWILGLDHGDRSAIDGACEIFGVDADEFIANARPYMTGAEVGQLVADGFTVGSHSRAHVPMETYRSYDEIEEEIVDSCRAVRDITGQPEVPFAFPFSQAGVDPDRLEQTVSTHDVVGLAFGTGGLGVGPKSLVNRVTMDSPRNCGNRDEPRSNVNKLIQEAYGKQLMSSALRWSLPQAKGERRRTQ